MIKKLGLMVSCLIIVMLTFTGCGSKAAKYTYDTTTGDKIEMKLKNASDYKVSSEMPFEITKGDELQVMGQFISLKEYESARKEISEMEDSKMTIVEESKKNGNEFICWNYNNNEFLYLMKIKDSNTAVVLGNETSLEVAQDIFKKLEFSIVK